eukprot:scaffold670_cov333-Pavlova_lutheri.AAC.9
MSDAYSATAYLANRGKRALSSARASLEASYEAMARAKAASACRRRNFLNFPVALGNSCAFT